MYFRTPGRTDFKGEEIPKDSQWIELIGALHEASYAIGMARALNNFMQNQNTNAERLHEWVKTLKNRLLKITEQDGSPCKLGLLTNTDSANEYWNHDPDNTELYVDQGTTFSYDAGTALENVQVLLLLMSTDLGKPERDHEFLTKNWNTIIESGITTIYTDSKKFSDALPGDEGVVSTALMNARAVCQRAERVMTSIQSDVPEVWFEFIDRLSNKLAALANQCGLYADVQQKKNQIT